jgi:hypothetical protein
LHSRIGNFIRNYKNVFFEISANLRIGLLLFPFLDTMQGGNPDLTLYCSSPVTGEDYQSAVACQQPQDDLFNVSLISEATGQSIFFGGCKDQVAHDLSVFPPLWFWQHG